MAEEELVRRLYRVCRWAEEHAAQLRELNERIDAELARDDSLLSPTGLTNRIAAEPSARNRIDALCLMSDRYDTELRRRIRHDAALLGCPDLEVAASCWEFLALNDFYRDGRSPIADDG